MQYKILNIFKDKNFQIRLQYIKPAFALSIAAVEATMIFPISIWGEGGNPSAPFSPYMEFWYII